MLSVVGFGCQCMEGNTESCSPSCHCRHQHTLGTVPRGDGRNQVALAEGEDGQQDHVLWERGRDGTGET